MSTRARRAPLDAASAVQTAQLWATVRFDGVPEWPAGGSDGAAGALRAWKLTGDENVPRGALSWEVALGAGAPAPEQLPPCAHTLGDLSRYKLFGGSGTVSARAFL